jgi:hypothetical protein
MPEYIKILGQVQASAAASTAMLNGFPDPNFEGYTSNQTFSPPNAGQIFSVGNSYYSGSTTSNNQVWYNSDRHTFSATSGRTNVLAFTAHNSNSGASWNLQSSTKPFLELGKTYTMSFWAFANGTGNWQDWNHSSLRFYNGSGWSNFWDYTTGWMNGSGWQSGWQGGTSINNQWRQHYRTFTGQGGFFDLNYDTWNHNSDYWTRLWLDSFYLTEGAIPLALIPNTNPISGASGNPNVLFEPPFTVRSEGWQGTAYASPTIKKSTGAWVTGYTVPDNRTAVISTISIANMASSTSTYRLAVVKAGETLTLKHIIAFDQQLALNSNEQMSVGITLSAGDKILCQSDTDKVQFSIFGSESTV